MNHVIFILNIIASSFKWTKCKNDKCKTRKHSNACSHISTLLSSKMDSITNAEHKLQSSKLDPVIKLWQYTADLYHVAEKKLTCAVYNKEMNIIITNIRTQHTSKRNVISRSGHNNDPQFSEPITLVQRLVTQSGTRSFLPIISWDDQIVCKIKSGSCPIARQSIMVFTN